MSDASTAENSKARGTVSDTEPNSDDSPPKDPTINVQNLLRAAVIRVDDLREAETRRVNQMMDSERRRVNEQRDLIAQYERLLREAEAKRIDAIRVVDVNAVSVANERAAAQAQVLANQVSTSAETLRALVATTATATSAQFAQVTGQFSERIAVLERSSYEGKGRESYSDPVLAQLILEVKALSAARSEGSGKGAGLQASWGIGLAVLGAIGTVAGIIAVIVALAR